ATIFRQNPSGFGLAGFVVSGRIRAATVLICAPNGGSVPALRSQVHYARHDGHLRGCGLFRRPFAGRGLEGSGRPLV
ncbi:MAG: hypothetical protein ACOVMO_08985, partial [Caulobacter sp.]